MSPNPDFLRPVQRPHGLAWVALAVALAVLLVAGLDAWQAARALALADAEDRAPRPARTAPPARTDATAERALADALARLDRGWSAAFHGVEALQAPGLVWLGLRIDETGALHLEGQAPDSATALAAAAGLRRQDAWRDVVLGRMESRAEGGMAFEIRAARAGGQP